jgi:hypothetical protein
VSKSGIVAIVVGLVAVALVVFAATSRQMSNADFLIAAYVVAAVIIVGYIVSLTGRLEKIWRNRGSED